MFTRPSTIATSCIEEYASSHFLAVAKDVRSHFPPMLSFSPFSLAHIFVCLILLPTILLAINREGHYTIISDDSIVRLL